jgi:thiamine transport system ATP-binding protein
MSGIDLAQVRLARGGQRFAFDHHFVAGSATAIIGPSGSGKTTLLHLVAGFAGADSGTISINGTDVTRLPPSKRPVTMIFQENNLFAHLDVLSNVGLGRRTDLKLGANDRADIAAAFADVGLSGMEQRLPASLSGGERQRVGIARALIRRNPVLLLDEPFAALGPALRRDMIALIRHIAGRNAMTVLMVTHQPDDAVMLGDRLAFIDDGRIAAEGPVSDMLDRDSSPPSLRAYLGN